jgi:nucleoside-diphosphate-sugar epimerase
MSGAISFQQEEQMRVLVTGSHGFIGTILVPMLMRDGHEVVGLDSDLYRYCTYGNALADIEHIKKDIRDIEKSDIAGYDSIMHLAGLSNDMLGDLNPSLTFEINHEASVRLAKIAKDVGVKRFIFSSSCSSYGAAGDQMLDEKAPFNPVTPYAKSKVLVERDVAMLASPTFSPTFLRNSTAYGVSSRIRFDVVINNLTAWAFTTGQVLLKSDGTPWRPVVHIEDISRAFIAVLHAPREKVHNQAFNIGKNSENYQIRELAEFVKMTVPGCSIKFNDDAGPDKRCYRVDFSKYEQNFPEYKLQWNAREGTQNIYASYQKYGLKKEEYEGEKYKRIEHIKYLLRTGQLDETLRWKE